MHLAPSMSGQTPPGAGLPDVRTAVDQLRIVALRPRQVASRSVSAVTSSPGSTRTPWRAACRAQAVEPDPHLRKRSTRHAGKRGDRSTAEQDQAGDRQERRSSRSQLRAASGVRREGTMKSIARRMAHWMTSTTSLSLNQLIIV